jgi:hypothetical protein
MAMSVDEDHPERGAGEERHHRGQAEQGTCRRRRHQQAEQHGLGREAPPAVLGGHGDAAQG